MVISSEDRLASLDPIHRFAIDTSLLQCRGWHGSLEEMTNPAKTFKSGTYKKKATQWAAFFGFMLQGNYLLWLIAA